MRAEVTTRGASWFVAAVGTIAELVVDVLCFNLRTRHSQRRTLRRRGLTIYLDASWAPYHFLFITQARPCVVFLRRVLGDIGGIDTPSQPAASAAGRTRQSAGCDQQRRSSHHPAAEQRTKRGWAPTSRRSEGTAQSSEPPSWLQRGSTLRCWRSSTASSDRSREHTRRAGMHSCTQERASGGRSEMMQQSHSGNPTITTTIEIHVALPEFSTNLAIRARVTRLS